LQIDGDCRSQADPHKRHHDVQYEVSDGVATRRETFAPAPNRTSAEKLAKQVPNVKQVGNDLEVKGKEVTLTR